MRGGRRWKKWNPWRLRGIALRLLQEFGLRGFTYSEAKRVIPELTRYAIRKLKERGWIYTEKRKYYVAFAMFKDKPLKFLLRKIVKESAKRGWSLRIGVITKQEAAAMGHPSAAGLYSRDCFGPKIQLISDWFTGKTILHEVAHMFLDMTDNLWVFDKIYNSLTEQEKELVKSIISDYALKSSSELGAEFLATYIIWRWTGKRESITKLLDKWPILWSIAREYEEFWAPLKTIFLRNLFLVASIL